MGVPADEKNDEVPPNGEEAPAEGNPELNRSESNTAARLRAEAADAMSKMAALSPREREVIDFIARGYSIKEIAKHLSVSPKSVETYRARLIEKLDAKSPAALMRIAVLVSLMEPLSETPPEPHCR
jgi:DNA-binding NarL/FixJ family response regulator